MPFNRSFPLSLLALSLVACADSSAISYPPSDASSDHDASIDVLPADALDAAEADVVDVHQDAADAPVEAAIDACSLDAAPEASDGPCQPGQSDRIWCGQCGRQRRVCGAAGSWGEWTPCLEDEYAACSPCETTSVGCGACGTQTVFCETSGQTCRWAREACEQKGTCSPGAYELNPSGCSSGEARIRWCGADCSWAPYGACGAPPRWQSLDPPPLVDRSGTLSVEAGDAWVVWGGRSSAGEYLSDGALFDAGALTWTLLPEPPAFGADGGPGFSGRELAAGVWSEACLFLFGGLGGPAGKPLGDGARWCPATGWSELSGTGAPSARAGATATWTSAAGFVVVLGGSSGFGNAAPGGGRYAPSKDAWSPLAPEPSGSRQEHSAVWDPAHQRVLVFGGRRGDGQPPRLDGGSYNPVTDTWTSIADAPIRRAGHVAVWDSTRSKMVVLFGEDDVWPGPRTDGAAYDPASDTWYLLPDLSVSGYPIGEGCAVAFGGGAVWVTGGSPSLGATTSLGARFDLATESWAALPPMAAGRTGHATAYLGAPLVWSDNRVERLDGWQ